MNATLQAKSAKSSSKITERHVIASRERAPRQVQQPAARPSRLQRFLAALVSALAVPTI